ncbi:c-type cytochrome [Paraburkholderia aromaticivorans]|uniref:c-type cytochrome n=1 Tax=Paraburkholderia aromaticivorans TaxID=2026199 RepID=UPI001456221B|nr:c-type cytochrome [Paraburkholderia aromaticivorans]
MNTLIGVLALALAAIFCTPAMASTGDKPPAWAYPVNPPDFKPRAEDGVLRHVPDSRAAYSVTQLSDRFIAPVWHPEDHPSMPPIVARGRKPQVYACGMCHRESGSGGPESASLAGLPADYIVQQLADFRSGARKSAVPKRNVDLMVALSRPITEAEVNEAAAYFSALKPRPNIKVIETATVPKTHVAGMFLVASRNGETEPIGHRIIEVPVHPEQFENRDPRAQFIAYVPPGSIEKGERLVRTGAAGKTQQCASCHGQNLKGVGNIPSIAGRSPSYIVRQLYDIQSHARTGPAVQPMNGPVADLTADDMASIAAYLASLKP